MKILDSLIQQIQDFEKVNVLLEQNNSDSFNWHHQYPAQNDQKGKKEFDIKVTELRPFTFNNSRNLWVWFKNLVVPTFRLNATMNNNSKAACNNPKNALPQLYAKTLCLKKLENNQFEEVMLNGKISEKFSKDMCLIQGIKYSETTFVSRSQYFRMIILVSSGKKVEDIADLQELEDIIISPPIYVEARQKFWLTRQSSYENYDPFPQEMLEKKYEYYSKQNNEKSVLGDDISSLYNYFLNPYIRHKSINPLFLAMKFPKALQMHINKDLIPKEYLDEKQQIINKNFLVFYQKTIYKILDQNQNSNENTSNAPFILFSLNEYGRDGIHPEYEFLSVKITSFLSPLTSNALTYSSKLPSPLPCNYVKLSNMDELKVVYKQNYNILEKLKVSRSHQVQKQESDDDKSNQNQKISNNINLQKIINENTNVDKCCSCNGIINKQNKKRKINESIGNSESSSEECQLKNDQQIQSSIVIDLTCRDILQKKVKLTIPIFKNEEQRQQYMDRKKASSIENNIPKQTQNIIVKYPINLQQQQQQEKPLTFNLQKYLEEYELGNCMSTNQEEINDSTQSINRSNCQFNSYFGFGSDKSTSDSQILQNDQKNLMLNLRNQKLQTIEGFQNLLMKKENTNLPQTISNITQYNNQDIKSSTNQQQHYITQQLQQYQQLQNNLQMRDMQLNNLLQIQNQMQIQNTPQQIDFSQLQQQIQLQQLQQQLLNQNQLFTV